jgi:hypothetical protein
VAFATDADAWRKEWRSRTELQKTLADEIEAGFADTRVSIKREGRAGGGTTFRVSLRPW